MLAALTEFRGIFKISYIILSLALSVFGIVAFIFWKGWGLLLFVFVTAIIRKMETAVKPHTETKSYDLVILGGYLIVLFSIYFTLLFSNIAANYETKLLDVHDLGKVTILHDQIFSVHIDELPAETNVHTITNERIRRGAIKAKKNPERMRALYGTFLLGWILYIILHSSTRLYRKRSSKSFTQSWIKEFIKTPNPEKMIRNNRRLLIFLLFLFSIMFLLNLCNEKSDFVIATKIIKPPIKLISSNAVCALFLWYLDRFPMSPLDKTILEQFN